MENIDLSLEISRLLHYGLQQGLLEKEDLSYSANRMLALLGAREFTPQPVEEELPYPAEPLERVCDWAAQQGLLDPDTRGRQGPAGHGSDELHDAPALPGGAGILQPV